MNDEIQGLVIDNGGSMMKAGFSGKFYHPFNYFSNFFFKFSFE